LTIFINYRKGEQEILPDLQAKKVDISLQKITLTNTQDGVASWKLEADAADFDTRSREGRLNGVRVTFFGSQEGDLILTADEGELASGGERMIVRGNVVVRGKQGYTFYSDDLEYLQKDDLISTQSPVRLVADGLDLRGRGLRFRVKNRSLRILDEVDANFVRSSPKNNG
jgi:LPS export ABC transporter protein LptC